MGRGVSAGRGQSSLGYLFGSGDEPGAAKSPVPVAKTTSNASSPPQTGAVSTKIDKQIPAGIHGSPTNNYFRADGQNCGNFITDRPSTKVHAAPGGGSSLGYLFGGGSGGS
ncbi:Protein SPIRAL1-like [Parasponia andersonii]|uniref:Protein SPIRAL1-like n=1 Tax=Parasponia andersonii TaxID=3476 RepID=A0A2P5ASD2_PARAD|nr:Protein SPIRAL1-like [Parasponia andersonii]